MAQGTTRGVPIDTDPLLAADSDLLVPSQKAVKTYITANAVAFTSLSANSPLSYNNAGIFSISQSSGSTNGYLSSTDWTTFNSKQNALTNPVTGTGTTNELSYFTGTSTIGSLSTATYPSLTELSYVKGVTSSLQTQLNGKQSTLTNPITGTGTNNEIAYFNTTGSTIGSLTTATYPSLTELSYVKGVTSAIQTQINGKQASGNYTTDDLVSLGQQALGSSIIGVGLGCRSLANITNSLAMTDGQIYLSAVYLPFSATITGSKWFQIVAGVYTADNYNGIGLYTYSGGTLTLVASSTNDGNIWKSTGAQSKAFSSPYSASAGVYYLGYLYNSSAQTTAPSITGAPNKSNGTFIDFTNSAKINATLTAATLTTPIAMSSTTGVQATWGMFIY
jgi:hypothetical protein